MIVRERERHGRSWHINIFLPFQNLTPICKPPSNEPRRARQTSPLPNQHDADAKWRQYHTLTTADKDAKSPSKGGDCPIYGITDDDINDSKNAHSMLPSGWPV